METSNIEFDCVIYKELDNILLKVCFVVLLSSIILHMKNKKKYMANKEQKKKNSYMSLVDYINNAKSNRRMCTYLPLRLNNMYIRISLHTNLLNYKK